MSPAATATRSEINKAATPHRARGPNKHPFQYWSKAEDQKLVDNASKLPLSELRALFPHRSSQAVLHRAKHLKALTPAISFPDWTPREVELLRELYGRATMAEIQAQLPGRSPSAISTRASLLKFHRPPGDNWWSEEEDRILRQFADSRMSTIDIHAMLPGRSLTSLYARLKRLGLSRPHQGWPPDEVDILVEHYPKHGLAGVKALLPHRGDRAIYSMANKLGLACHELTSDEVDTLRTHITAGKSIAEIRVAYLPHRAEGFLNRKAISLGLISKRRRKWGPQEDRKLRSAYGRGGIEAAVKAFPHLSRETLTNRARYLYLRAGARKPIAKFTDAEIQTIRDLFPSGGAAAVAAVLVDRDKKGIEQKARTLGIQRA